MKSIKQNEIWLCEDERESAIVLTYWTGNTLIEGYVLDWQREDEPNTLLKVFHGDHFKQYLGKY